MNSDSLIYPIVCFEKARAGTFSVVTAASSMRVSTSLSIKWAIEHNLIWVDSSGAVYDIVSITRISRGKIRDWIDTICNSPVSVTTELDKQDSPMALSEFVSRIGDEFEDPVVAEVYEESGLDLSLFRSLLQSATSIAEIIGFLVKSDEYQAKIDIDE